MKTLDVDEWLLSKNLNPLAQIKKNNSDELVFITDVMEMLIEENIASIAYHLKENFNNNNSTLTDLERLAGEYK